MLYTVFDTGKKKTKQKTCTATKMSSFHPIALNQAPCNFHEINGLWLILNYWVWYIENWYKTKKRHFHWPLNKGNDASQQVVW